MSKYVDKDTLQCSLKQLQGTAGTIFRIWMTLKHMGLTLTTAVSVTTVNSKPSIDRLFSCGHPSGKLFTPYVSIPSDRFMAPDANRSIIQTTIRQWLDSSGVYNPIEFLQVDEGIPSGQTKPLVVRTKRTYPEGLGLGKNGFAHNEDKRVSVPSRAFAVWYGRKTAIPDDKDAISFLLAEMRRDLHLSVAEEGCVFTDTPIDVTTQSNPLTDADIFKVVDSMNMSGYSSVEISESKSEHIERIHSVQTISESPKWMTNEPAQTLKDVVNLGVKAVLLYGPPRTGKTRAIDAIFKRDAPERQTIQIHDGWGYDQLIQGLRPQPDQSIGYVKGVLAKAIDEGKKVIVLEEINRTLISQSLGEVFSLIEDDYRGESNKISLRDGSSFFIPEDVVFYMTMNTVDKSTEDIDDALLGRCFSVEFPPRVEDLAAMLRDKGVEASVSENLCKLFGMIQNVYPLGHGYFSQYNKDTNPLLYYQTKVRPVLLNHLQHYKPVELTNIDNMVDELFAS